MELELGLVSGERKTRPSQNNCPAVSRPALTLRLIVHPPECLLDCCGCVSRKAKLSLSWAQCLAPRSHLSGNLPLQSHSGRPGGTLVREGWRGLASLSGAQGQKRCACDSEPVPLSWRSRCDAKLTLLLLVWKYALLSHQKMRESLPAKKNMHAAISAVSHL